MMEDFLVKGRIPKNPVRYSVMPDSQADFFTQDQYRLSFMRLIAVLDADPNANLNPRDLSEAGEQDAACWTGIVQAPNI